MTEALAAASHGNLVNAERITHRLRYPDAAGRGQPRPRPRRRGRGRRPQRRRQDHAAAGADRRSRAGLRPGGAHRRRPRSATCARPTTPTPTATVRDVIVGGAARPRLGRAGRAPGPWSSTCWPGSTWTLRWPRSAAASGGGSASPSCCWPTTTCWCWTSRPTTSTSRRWTGWPSSCARWQARGPGPAGGQPRPLVPGRDLHPDLGGPRRRRSTRTTAATRRTCWPGPNGPGRRPASPTRRKNLLRKELAWLRRGPPARTASRSSGSTRPTR